MCYINFQCMYTIILKLVLCALKFLAVPVQCLCSIPIPVPPLFVIEFLHRVIDVFTEYFSECNERVIKDQYVIVYEVSDQLISALLVMNDLGHTHN